jgi:hypothetical protein
MTGAISGVRDVLPVSSRMVGSPLPCRAGLWLTDTGSPSVASRWSVIDRVVSKRLD